jgi:hypothetical protein
MLQSTTLDSQRVVIRSDEESDMQELLSFLNRTSSEKKSKLLSRFLEFAKDNYSTEPSFKFNRKELYDSEIPCQATNLQRLNDIARKYKRPAV